MAKTIIVTPKRVGGINKRRLKKYSFIWNLSDE
jgi:hypothetical protein